MKTPSKIVTVGAAFAAALGVTVVSSGSAFAVGPPGGPPGQAGRVSLPGSRPAWASSHAFTGTTAGSSQIAFRVYLSWRSDPTNLIKSVTTPGSPEYGHYLTAAQFNAQFAPSAAEVASVSHWLRSAGLTVEHVPTNRLYVAAQGTVAQADAAFNTTLGNYSVQGMTLRAPETTPSVPSSLPQVSVIGLDDSAALVHTDHITPTAPPAAGFRNPVQCGATWGAATTQNTPEPTPLAVYNPNTKKTFELKSKTGSVTLPNYPNPSTTPTNFSTCGYTPAQLRGAYGLTKADNGKGQTVAVIDAYASPTIVQDVNKYFYRHNVTPTGAAATHFKGNLIPPLSAKNFTQVVHPGTYKVPNNLAQYPSDWYGEETLDVEAVHAMAPKAHIVFVGAPNAYQDLDAALNTVVSRHLASMVTNSYGWSTEALPPGYIKPYMSIMQEAAATGIGVYFSSGDFGDETGGNTKVTPTPDWPASSPLVTAVGGTTLAVGTSTAPNQFVGEWGWETGKAVLEGRSQKHPNLHWSTTSYMYGSGGGVSHLFAEPGYQQGVVPNSVSNGMRVVPDVSALGDPTTGMLIGQTQTYPNGTTHYGEYRIGGTSLSSPLFTGMMADVQHLASARKGSQVDIGFANPLLYSKQGVFRDIRPVHGRMALIRSDYANYVNKANGYLASARTIGQTQSKAKSNPWALSIKVTAGYDDVTGLGAPKGLRWFRILAKGAVTQSETPKP